MAEIVDRSVLIVDDTPSNLAVAVAMLEKEGLQIMVAQSGEEALRRIAFLPPDLILLDVMLPGIDGFEFCRQLKSAGGPESEIPVIFMTALSDTEDKLAGFSSGAVDYVTKPLQLAEVLARVNTHLRITAMQSELKAQNDLLLIENATRRAAEDELRQYKDSLQAEVLSRTSELRESEAKFRTLCENLPDPVVRYDHNKCRTYFNPAYEKVPSFSAEFSMGSSGPGGGHAEMAVPQFDAVLNSALVEGIPSEVKLRFLSEIGTQELEMAIRVAPERGLNGKINGVLAIGRDITALVRAERELANSHSKLRELAAHQEHMREEERKHIARELHDELGQSLTALRMSVALLRLRYGEDLPTFKEDLGNVIKLVDHTIEVVRNVATSLRPAMLDAGITTALEWLVDDFQKWKEIDCNLVVSLEENALDEKQSIAVFRIVQESLNNIARHSYASSSKIFIHQSNFECILRIEDNGVGFDPTQTFPNSFGLMGIRERVLTVRGNVVISSEIGIGTRLIIKFPL